MEGGEALLPTAQKKPTTSSGNKIEASRYSFPEQKGTI